MTTGNEIIFWTAMIFVVMASERPVHGEGKDGVCNVTVNELKSSPVFKDVRCVDRTLFEISGCKVVGYKNYTVPKVEQKCCEGYENSSNRNSPCVPRCSPRCESGNCTTPNECTCKPGWSGKTCSESTLCFVKANSAETLRLPVEAETKIATENTLRELGRPACLPKCRNQTSNFAVTNQVKEKFYFLPVETPCNIEADPWIFLKTYKYLLAGSVGIVLLAIIIICIVCVVKRKRRTLNEVNDIPMQSGSLQECMVENEIYS